MRAQLLFAIVALSALFMLAAAEPAEACRQHEAGLPESAALDGPIAEMIEATEGMTRKQRAQYIRNLPTAERTALQQEIRSLPQEEQRAFTKAMRMSPTKAKGQPAAPAGN